MRNLLISLSAVATVLLCQCSSPPTLSGVTVGGSGADDPLPLEGNQPVLHVPDAVSESVLKVETGKSSWYSVKTNGGTQTASGIPFSDHKYTVAHKTLPFGTKVRVTNLNNGHSVVGTVTDRGPFITGRIVDLSPMMAKQIDAYHVGVAPCKLEVLSRPQ